MEKFRFDPRESGNPKTLKKEIDRLSAKVTDEKDRAKKIEAIKAKYKRINSEGSELLLKVTWTGHKLIYFTQERVVPQYWDRAKFRARNTTKYPQGSKLNKKLDKIEKEAKEAFQDYLNMHGQNPPTVEELRHRLDVALGKVQPDEKPTLFKYIAELIEREKKKGKLKTGTINNLNQSFKLLKKFRSSLDFDQINNDLYVDFLDFLKNHTGKYGKRLSENTIGKHIKHFKYFLREADSEKIALPGYFKKKFHVPKEDVESIYLNELELQDLFELDLSSNKKLERVRDLFLVGCWTGLRFSDFSRIGPENIKGNMIEIETQKTGKKVVIPIHHIVKTIMERYQEEYSNSLPPAISNAKMNEYLKDVAKLVDSLMVPALTSITRGGVKVSKNVNKYELVCTHTARRSFATNIYKSGFPAISIMKITGHKTEDAFLRYIKVTAEENAILLDKHWQEKEKSQMRIAN